MNNGGISNGFKWKSFLYRQIYEKRRGEKLASLVANASREPIRAQ